MFVCRQNMFVDFVVFVSLVNIQDDEATYKMSMELNNTNRKNTEISPILTKNKGPVFLFISIDMMNIFSF